MAERGQAALCGKPQQAKIVSRIPLSWSSEALPHRRSFDAERDDSGSRKRAIRVRALPKSVYNRKPVWQLGQMTSDKGLRSLIADGVASAHIRSEVNLTLDLIRRGIEFPEREPPQAVAMTTAKTPKRRWFGIGRTPERRRKYSRSRGSGRITQAGLISGISGVAGE
jgi:hypothetical protein